MYQKDIPWPMQAQWLAHLAFTTSKWVVFRCLLRSLWLSRGQEKREKKEKMAVQELAKILVNV